MECIEDRKDDGLIKWFGFCGQGVDKVVDYLSKRYPDLKIHKVPKGAFVTDDLRPNRVRVYYDQDGLVCSDPITC